MAAFAPTPFGSLTNSRPSTVAYLATVRAPRLPWTDTGGAAGALARLARSGGGRDADQQPDEGDEGDGTAPRCAHDPLLPQAGYLLTLAFASHVHDIGSCQGARCRRSCRGGGSRHIHEKGKRCAKRAT